MTRALRPRTPRPAAEYSLDMRKRPIVPRASKVWANRWSLAAEGTRFEEVPRHVRAASEERERRGM